MKKLPNQWWRSLGYLLLIAVFFMIGSIGIELYDQYQQQSSIRQEFGIGGGPDIPSDTFRNAKNTPTPTIVGEPTLMVLP